ncbi:extracellular solute-binding protein [Radiobacillus kanasensis]|uniref:ABC transporter substrate-binding protein n=1 Tax=Radiobacillus kanasensis TaxID=2844358 RepID=UPI001E3EB0A9|nr:extracellular solute-binding protein [Radiobacillus kanasensis]UFT98711.1 extracellular solute-binding protein [Radiobacillus kanasensis]
MKSLNKFWLAGLFALFALFLAACSSDAGSEEGEGSEGESAEESEGVTLTIGSWRTEDTERYQALIDAFNEKYPDINVEFKPSKNTEYNTILNTALKAGEGPDIIHLRPYAPGIQLADQGYLAPLDDINGLDVFPESSLAAAKGSDGKQYGVPLNISTTQMFYNKAIFEELGLEEPKTWDEFIALNETLKSEGYTPISLGTKEGWLLSLAHGIFGPAHYGANDFVEKIAAGETDFTSEEFLSSIKAMDELKKYFPENYEGLGMEDIRTLFFTETAAMFPMGSWEIEVLREMNPDLELGFFPMPSAVGKDATVTTWVDGSYGVNAKSEHVEEAKKFVEFMTTKEFGNLFTEKFKMISAIPGTESDDELVNNLGKAVESNPTPYMMLVHFSGGNPTTKVTLETELQGMYLGEQTPEGVTEALQENAATWFEPFQ